MGSVVTFRQRQRGRGSIVGGLSAAICILIVLGGCSGSGPEPAPFEGDGGQGTQQSSPSPSPTQTPTPTAESGPVTAEDMPRDQLKAEVDTFVGKFLDALDRAEKTGETTQIRQMSDPACGPCYTPLQLIEKTYEAGNKIVGEGYGDPKIYFADRQPVVGNQVNIYVTVPQGAAKIVNSDGDKLRTFESATWTYSLVLERKDKGQYHITKGQVQ